MQLINLKQGSPEWLAFRRKHICASDAATCLGINPWKSPLKLYEEKIFQFEEEDNHFMARGRELEPLALQSFEEETGLVLFPAVVKHDSIDWIAASLDGLTIDRKAIVEIKCNGSKNHELVLKGKIPKVHEAQIQHQLECTGLSFAYYYSFDGEKGKILEISRNQGYIDFLLEKELQFWNCLKRLTPPSL